MNPTKDKVEGLEHDVDLIRNNIGDLLGELNHRRHEAFDLKLQFHRHARGFFLVAFALVGAIIVATLLLVTGALALSLVLPGWAAGLIVTGVVAIAVAIVAGVSWKRRVRTPLSHSRSELKEDVRFAKERFA